MPSASYLVWKNDGNPCFHEGTVMTSEDQDTFPSIQGGVDDSLGALRFIWRFKLYGTPTALAFLLFITYRQIMSYVI